MANIVGLDLNIDQDYLADAIKQSVLMGISQGLDNKNGILSQIVKMTLEQKVNEKGVPTNSSYDAKYTLLEYYVRKLITEEVKSEMSKIVDERRPEIQEVIRKELAKKATVNKFVDCFLKSLENSLTDSYYPHIDIEWDKKRTEY